MVAYWSPEDAEFAIETGYRPTMSKADLTQLRKIVKRQYCANPIRLCAWSKRAREMGTGRKVEWIEDYQFHQRRT